MSIEELGLETFNTDTKINNQESELFLQICALLKEKCENNLTENYNLDSDNKIEIEKK